MESPILGMAASFLGCAADPERSAPSGGFKGEVNIFGGMNTTPRLLSKKEGKEEEVGALGSRSAVDVKLSWSPRSQIGNSLFI